MDRLTSNEGEILYEKRNLMLHLFRTSTVFRSVLQVSLIVILLSSCGSAALGIMTLVSNNFIEAWNEKGIMYTTMDNAVVPSMSILLVPQFEVNLGMLYFSIGSSYVSRKNNNLLPFSSLRNAEVNVDPDLPIHVRDAYVRVRQDALQFGYATAESCGGISAGKVMSLSLLVVSATSIGVISAVVVLVLVAHFFGILPQFAPVSGAEKKKVWDKSCRLVIDIHEFEQPNTLAECKTTKQWCRYLKFVCVFSIVAGNVFFLMALITEYILQTSLLKCGRSFCETYQGAMQDLMHLLPAVSHEISCRVGYSFYTLFAGTLLQFVVLGSYTLVRLMYFIYYRRMVVVLSTDSGAKEMFFIESLENAKGSSSNL